jgi:hypothetical protein
MRMIRQLLGSAECRSDERARRAGSARECAVLELIDATSGSRIELEHVRLPITHSKDVIQDLT